MNEEKNGGKVLIEETDAGRHRRENPEPEPGRKRVSGWVIATVAVVVVGIVAGLSVYFVQQKQKNEVYERTVSVVTDKATTTSTTEEDFEIEDSDDIIIAEDDAVGGDLQEEETTDATWSFTTSDKSEDDTSESDGTTGKTTRRTTRRRTTAWDPQKAAEDFWNEVSKWAQ